jgi:hypothetical protein
VENGTVFHYSTHAVELPHGSRIRTYYISPIS